MRKRQSDRYDLFVYRQQQHKYNINFILLTAILFNNGIKGEGGP